MDKPKKQLGAHPTVGPAFLVGKAVERIFETWLPPPWLPRPESPDFHVDYNVELVEAGEPTGRHFRVQLKGRTAKLKGGKIKESFETKHLRYYLKCELPVFVFRIDPNLGSGYWLFIQGYLRERKIKNERLAKPGDLTIEFDPHRSLEAKDLFRLEVEKALAFMKDQFPGSPMAAIQAHKKKLEALDPRIEVKIEATDKGMGITLTPKDQAQVLSPTIFTNLTPEQFNALQGGKPINVKATDVSVDTPILQELLNKEGENEIMLAAAGNKVAGSIQIVKEGAAPFEMLQVNGEYTAHPQRLLFEASLPDSPLTIRATWTGASPAEFSNPVVTFGFQFGAWACQPLLLLAFFDDLKRLTSPGAVTLRFLAKGGEFYRGMLPTMDFSSEPMVGEFITWIGKCRTAAAVLGQNPLFPEGKHFNALETSDMRFLIHMLETGRLEQDFSGNTLEAVGTFSQVLIPHESGYGFLQMPGQYQTLNFLGSTVSFGPMNCYWNVVRLAQAEFIDGNQQKLTWVGGPDSKFITELSPEAYPSRHSPPSDQAS